MDEQLLLSPEQAFALVGIGRSTGYRLLSTGEIPSIKIGRLRRIPRHALEQWVRIRTEEARPVEPPAAMGAAWPGGTDR